MQVRKLRPVSAYLDVATVRMVLAFLVEQDQLSANPLIGVKLPKGKKKTVVWLSPDQVGALWQIKPGELLGNKEVSTYRVEAALFWYKVIILTGMDYVDAVSYVQDRAAYEGYSIGGRKIIMKRGKNESECHIPFPDKLEELLSGPIPGAHRIQSVNNGLAVIRELIGFEAPLITKIGRKTAGLCGC